MEHILVLGKGRTQISLQASALGSDMVICISNSGAHIGAVAVGEYDFQHSRASVSVITRLGHKDDAIAQKAAYVISKSMQRPVCVVAGVHLDNITQEEIREVMDNTTEILERFVKRLKSEDSARGKDHVNRTS